MTGNIHRLGEALRRAVEEAALQILLRREGDGMNEQIEPSPILRDGSKTASNSPLRDVERRLDFSAKLISERFDVGTRLVVRAR